MPWRTLALPLALAAVCGCVLDVRDRRDVVYGSATVTWAIGGSPEPGACASYGIDGVRAVLEHDDGTLVADDRVPCRASSVRWVLRRGWYAATVTLLDGAGAALSAPRRSIDFYVAPERDTLVVVDFVPPVGSGGGALSGE